MEDNEIPGPMRKTEIPAAHEEESYTNVAREPLRREQWFLISVVVAFTAGAILYRLLIFHHLGRSAAMFLGLPAVLAILLSLTPQARTATGSIVKGITLVLLVLAPLLGEGFLCILIASPLFYLVGIIIGLTADRYDRKHNRRVTYCLGLLLLPLCLEGVSPRLSLNRMQYVEATSIVAAPAAEVEKRLAGSLDTSVPLPRLLRIGFPHPLHAAGSGLAPGDTRTVHFAGAEGDPPGDLHMRVVERRPGYVRLEAVADTSKLLQWVLWRSSSMEWTAIDAHHTRVVSRIGFERELDPAWYFTPWERVVVRKAAAYLIAANATPQSTQQ